jgi:anti-sigma factor RsiW
MVYTDNCRKILVEISDYIDGELDEALCTDLEKHLSNCHNCTVVVNTLRKTVELYHSNSSAEILPDQVRSDLFARLNLSDYIKPNL